MTMRIAPMIAAFGVCVLTATAAVAQNEGRDLKEQQYRALAQQFDAVAPKHQDAAKYDEAMALRKKAKKDNEHAKYLKASSELREALRDLKVNPVM